MPRVWATESHRQAARRVLYFFVLCAIGNLARADIVSTSGNLRYDANNDGSFEATMNSNGLGIGTSAPSANLHVLGNVYVTGNLGLQASQPLSTLEISGSLGLSLQTITGNATLGANTLVLADMATAASNITVALPYAGNALGRTYRIKKSSGSYSLWLTGGGNYIDNDILATLDTATSGFPSVEVQSDGKQWYVISGGTASTTALSANLIGYWKLDETSGTTASDSSGKGRTGTLYNCTFSANSTPGKVGGALVFDGVDDYVEIPDTAGVPMAYTMTAWVKPLSSAGNQAIYYRGQTGANSWWVNINNIRIFLPGPKFEAFLWDGTPETARAGNTFVTGTWYFVAHRAYSGQSANALKLYVNGNLEAQAWAGTYSDYGTAWYLGKNVDTVWDDFNGVMDDVRLYNKALSQEEIRALYDASK